MKKLVLLVLAVFVAVSGHSQTKEHRLGIAGGGSIQQYNGNLGNSLFQFKTTCFAGFVFNSGYYLNRSFDINLTGSIGDFGYCTTKADDERLVAAELRCPGCTNQLGMGELRSRMVSGNLAIAYKFSNGYLLKEDCRFSPYIYVGAGISHLSDNMQKNCVTVGNHFSLNSGLGVKYRFCDRVYAGYNLGLACFPGKKVYATSGPISDELAHDEEIIQMEKRKDLLLQNSIYIGINLF